MSETLKIVKEINEEIEDILGDNYLDERSYFQLHYISNGKEEFIKFMNYEIWSSENDERSYDDEAKYEPLKPFIRNKVMGHLFFCSEIENKFKENE